MPVLTYLKAAHLVWDRGQETFGNGRSTAIARLATIGHLERKPYDYTALAEATHLSRQQVMRRCVRLAKAGWLVNERMDDRVLVRPTEALLTYWTEQVEQSRTMVSGWVKVAALLGLLGALVVAPDVREGEAREGAEVKAVVEGAIR